MKMRSSHYLNTLFASASALAMIGSAAAESKDSDPPEAYSAEVDWFEENFIDTELANYNLLEVSTDDSIFFTPAFVEAFGSFTFSIKDPDDVIEERFEDLYDNLNIGQIVQEVEAMRDLFYHGIAFFDILDESPLTNFGGGGFGDAVPGQSGGSTRGTRPPTGFGFDGIASWGSSAWGYATNRFGGSERLWVTDHEDGSRDEYFGGNDEHGWATGRTRVGADEQLEDTVILERRNDGGNRETYTNHRSGESQVFTRYAGGGTTATYRSSDGEVFVAKGTDGRVQKTVTYQDENGEVVTATSEHDPASETDTTGNPGDDLTASEREFANWLFGQHSLGRHNPGGSVKNPNRVNPGEPGDTGNQAPRINPGISIVINPNLNESTGSGRELTAEMGAAARQQLREKIGGKINPPGPGEAP